MTTRYRRPHRIKRKKPIYQGRFFWPGILMLIISAAFSYFLFFSQFFQIQKVIVFGNKKVPEKEIAEMVKVGLGKKKLFLASNNIFLVDLNQIEKNILDELSQIGNVDLRRSFPDTLNCVVEERTAKATFCQSYSPEGNEKCFFLDKQGIIFEETNKENLLLPKIKNLNLEEKLGLGKMAVKENLISKILEIFSELANIEIAGEEIVIISEERINVKTAQGWEIYFDPQKDLDWQLTKLKAVLEKYIPQEKRKALEYIELRFGNLAPFKYKNLPAAEP